MASWIERLIASRRIPSGIAGCVLVVALLSSLTATAVAQSAARPDKGVRPTGSYAVSDIENVNMTNGNLNVSIPLASLPPIAGGKLSWTLGARYNSKMWDMHSVEEQDISTIPFTRWITNRLQLSTIQPWLIGAGYRIDVTESHDDVDWRDPLCGDHTEPPYPCDPDFQLMQQHPSWFKITLTTPDGAVHELRPTDGSGAYNGFARPYLRGYSWKTPATTNTTMTYYSYDGSYLWAVIDAWDPSAIGVSPINWSVYLPDGTRIRNRSGNQNNRGQYIIDTNGNSIRIYSTTSGVETTTHYVDKQTLREIRLVFNQAVNPPFGQARVEYQTPENNVATVYINFRSTLFHGWAYNIGDPFCSDKAELILNTDFIVVDSIVLPQTEPAVSRQFSFQYNTDFSVPVNYQWRPDCTMLPNCNTQPLPPFCIRSASKGLGSLSHITMPSGATIDYSYLGDQPDTGSLLQVLLNPSDLPADTVIKKRVQHDGAPPEEWNYSTCLQLGRSSMTGPDGSVISEASYPHERAFQFTHGGLDGKGGLTYRTTQSNTVLVERKWRLNSINGAPAGSTGSDQLVPFNPVVEIEFTTLMDPPGTPAKMSAKQFQYDLNGNVISETDYDWFNPSLAAPYRDAQGVPTQVPPGATVLRVIANSYYNDSTTQTSPNIYSKRLNGDPPTPLILNAPRLTTTGPSQTQFHYDGIDGTAPSKGNLTKLRQWEGTRWIRTINAYDSFGNLISTQDPNDNITIFVYDSATQAQPVSVTVDPNPSPQVTGDELTTFTSYDFGTGLVKTVTDPNNKITTTSYLNQRLGTIDPFGRPGLVTDPQGRRTVMAYFDNGRQIEVSSNLKSAFDGLLKNRTTADQLGRTIKNESSEDGFTYSISSETVYHTAQRTTFTSNPHRSGPAPTDGWTRSTRDTLGRVVEVASFSGAVLPGDTGTGNSTGVVRTLYNANATTVTDQASKVRRSIADGLGRLVRVDEPTSQGLGLVNTPNQPTSYIYDVLGNMTQVLQGGQTRTFTYDALSRLKQAINPESGTIDYTYYDNSNLQTKRDARAVVTTFSYDGLNRVKTRTYSGPAPGGTTPPVTYSYDSATPAVLNSKGRLLSVDSSVSSYAYTSFDAVGRVLSCSQTTQGQTYLMSYQYNLAGGMTSEKYPSNKVVVTEYDNAGRTAGVKKDATNYYAGAAPGTPNAIAYAAHGAVNRMKLGNGLQEVTDFNSRLQTTQIRVGTVSNPVSVLSLGYDYGATTTNNSNLMSQRISIPGLDVTQNYTYDELNRLKTATEVQTSGGAQTWRQTYAFDRWGNRAVNQNSTLIPNPQLTPQLLTDFNTSNNRIQKAGFGYDAAGNLKEDPTTGPNGMLYDGENRMVSYTKAGVATTYGYDGDGRRVKKSDSTGTVVFVYNSGTQLIAEYSTASGEPGGTSYLTTDRLGSPGLITDASGNVRARHDFLPFGEEIQAPIGARTAGQGYIADSVRQKFTQKERDNESGLDHFFARYYSSAQGRFTSPDQPFADQDETDPQSWHLYTYVVNNPLKYDDPLGLWKKKETDDGTLVYIAEKGDTLEGLAKILFVPVKRLVGSLGGDKVQVGQEFDVSNYRDYQDDTFERFVFIIPENQVPGDSYRIEFGIPIPGIGRIIGKKGASVLGRAILKGLARNRPLRELTSFEIRKAFEESGYKLSNHAIKRFKDPRTEALGIKTLEDVKQLLNNGTISGAVEGKIAIEYGRLKAIVDQATKTIVSLVPR